MSMSLILHVNLKNCCVAMMNLRVTSPKVYRPSFSGLILANKALAPTQTLSVLAGIQQRSKVNNLTERDR